MVITITGFMGSGKSVVAKQLSNKTDIPMVDLDHFIEESEGGKTVSELFATIGEERFREKEQLALQKIIEQWSDKSIIVSLGGGTLLSSANREVVKKGSFCIYLRASLDTITTRIQHSYTKRPLLTTPNNEFDTTKLSKLFPEREFGYNYSSHMVVRVDNLSVDEIVDIIINRISSLN